MVLALIGGAAHVEVETKGPDHREEVPRDLRADCYRLVFR